MTAETYLYVQTVAKRIKCSERTVYRLIQEGHLRATRIGCRALRIPESALNDFLKSRVVDPDETLLETK